MSPWIISPCEAFGILSEQLLQWLWVDVSMSLPVLTLVHTQADAVQMCIQSKSPQRERRVEQIRRSMKKTKSWHLEM